MVINSKITVELLQKLKFRYEKKKPKLMSAEKLDPEKLNLFDNAIKKLRNIVSKEAEKPNSNEILLQEIEVIDKMIFAIGFLLYTRSIFNLHNYDQSFDKLKFPS